MKNTYEITFESNINALHEVHNDVMRFIANALHPLAADDAFDLKLIFSELLANAVIHGNRKDENKKVHLTVSADSAGCVYASIKDEGPGFNYLSALTDISTDESLFSEHGRGIRLVYSLTDSMSFNVAGNEIKFQKKVTRIG